VGRVCSCKNAQYLGETGQYPARYDKSYALFGYVFDLETIVTFYSEEFALHIRGRRMVVTHGRKAHGEEGTDNRFSSRMNIRALDDQSGKCVLIGRHCRKGAFDMEGAAFCTKRQGR
jgi:hypothetical protein